MVNGAILTDFSIWQVTQVEMYWKKSGQKASSKSAHRSLIVSALNAEKTQTQTRTSSTSIRQQLLDESLSNQQRSLLVFKVSNPVRLFCASIEDDPRSTSIFMLFVFVSLAALSFEGDFRNADGSENETATYYFRLLEKIVLGCFYFEMIVKSATNGFLIRCGPTTPYLRKTRNRMNFIALLILTDTFGKCDNPQPALMLTMMISETLLLAG